MLKYLIAYVSVGVIFAAADAVWLSSMSASLYRQTLGDVLVDGFRVAPAVLFYLLFIAGILIFAIQPAFADGRWTTALVYGALFGFFTYMTYDLTSHATVRNWTTTLSVVDIAWGTVLTGVSAAGGFALTSWVLAKLG